MTPHAHRDAVPLNTLSEFDSRPGDPSVHHLDHDGRFCDRLFLRRAGPHDRIQQTRRDRWQRGPRQTTRSRLTNAANQFQPTIQVATQDLTCHDRWSPQSGTESSLDNGPVMMTWTLTAQALIRGSVRPNYGWTFDTGRTRLTSSRLRSPTASSLHPRRHPPTHRLQPTTTTAGQNARHRPKTSPTLRRQQKPRRRPRRASGPTTV